MTLVIPSVKFLERLYNSISTSIYTTTDLNHNQSSIQSFIIIFLMKISEENYINMVNAIDYWINSTTIVAFSTGIQAGYPAKTAIPGLDIIIGLPDGTVAYDSNSTNNLFKNINIPHPNFLTNGKYLINVNHASRNYFMGACLSQSGSFNVKKWSTSTNGYKLYLAIRQGLTPNEPVGVIVISMNDINLSPH